MKQGKRWRWIVPGIVLGPVLGLWLLARSGSGFPPSQIVESDGHRQIEHGVFGSSFVTRTESVPGLKITDEAFGEMAKAGIRHIGPVSAASMTERGNMVIKTIRPSETVYSIRTKVSDNIATTIAHYRAQCTKVLPRPHSPSGQEFNGTLADGSRLRVHMSPMIGVKGQNDLLIQFEPR